MAMKLARYQKLQKSGIVAAHWPSSPQ